MNRDEVRGCIATCNQTLESGRKTWKWDINVFLEWKYFRGPKKCCNTKEGYTIGGWRFFIILVSV